MGDALCYRFIARSRFYGGRLCTIASRWCIGAHQVLLHVSDLMNKDDDIPRVSKEATLREALVRDHP